MPPLYRKINEENQRVTGHDFGQKGVETGKNRPESTEKGPFGAGSPISLTRNIELDQRLRPVQ
jgi:hypothetical protein